MPKPVSLLTVQEAHKEYSSLTDQIRAKYEQLDSGEFGSPGTAFDWMNWLIYEPTLSKTSAMPKDCTGPRSSSIEDTFGSKFTQAGSLG